MMSGGDAKDPFSLSGHSVEYSYGTIPSLGSRVQLWRSIPGLFLHRLGALDPACVSTTTQGSVSVPRLCAVSRDQHERTISEA